MSVKMPKLPPARACIIAEEVNEEVGGKSTIHGFSGLAPDVLITALTSPARINVCAFVLFDRPTEEGELDLSVELRDPQGRQLLPRTKISMARAELGKKISCALNFKNLPVNLPGEYTVKLFSQNAPHSQHHFSVNYGG